MTDTDSQLVARACEGDAGALAAILDLHLHPAWRIALASSPDADAAEAVAVTGFCDGLVAASRHPESVISLRTRIAGAVHRAAAASATHRRLPSATSEPVLAAFAALPVSSRTALWLTEVEGGTPEQIAPVLGLDRSATGALVDRATSALRDGLAALATSTAAGPECATALGKLPAHCAGRLTATERLEIGAHLTACGSCAGWLAGAVSIRPALRRLVVPIPDGLPLAIAERWAENANRDRTTWMRGLSERAIAAAAAAVLAVGLAGAALLGRDDDAKPELASPAGPLGLSGDVATALPDPVVPVSVRHVSTSSDSAGTGVRGVSVVPVAPPETPPTTAPPPPVTTPTAVPAPTTPAPAPPETPASEGPAEETQASAEVPGVVSVAVGDCTGIDVAGIAVGCTPPPSEEPAVEIQLPGLPPLSLP